MGCPLGTPQKYEKDPTVEDIEYSKSLGNDQITSPQRRFARRTSAHRGVMQAVAMKFSHIRASFVACEEVFNKYIENKRENHNRNDLLSKSIEAPYIRPSNLKTVLIELGVPEKSLTEENLKNMFTRCDINHDDKIDFKEFLIAAAIGCFLKDDNSSHEDATFLKIKKGFCAVQDAFKKIDKDNSGQIDYDELREAFLAMKDDDLTDQRLAELDFNGDQAIEFPEFVWGLSAWVGIFEVDVEEDEEDLNEDFAMAKENVSRNATLHSSEV